jgi:CHAD domain-containing protein
MNSKLDLREWGARVVLKRLAKLEQELVRLETQPDADSIHDSRVAGRRLRAALRHLEDEFRRGDAERLREEVALVAALLGEIRDLDILMQSLAQEARRPRSPFQLLLASLARRRARILARVAPAAQTLGRRLLWWQGRLSPLPGKVAAKGPSVADHFHKIYPKLVRRYFRKGGKLVRRQAGPEELHRFRIRTKRLRYVTELYADLAPDHLRATLRELRGVQEVLGSMQDQSMIVAYFERRLMDVRTPQRQTEYMRVLHRARMRQSFFREQFFRRWTRMEGLHTEKRWLAGLQRPQAKPRKRNQPSPNTALAKQ